VVPIAAVQRGAQGLFVYVVKPDHTVTVRRVTAGVTEGDDTSIAAGLSPGDLVVVEGADRLREGAKVEVRRGDGSGPGHS
jgi:multidrug efflux system membrane fusion protein